MAEQDLADLLVQAPALGWTPNSDRQILPLPCWGSESRGPLSCTRLLRVHAGPSESFGLGLAVLAGPGHPEQYSGSQPSEAAAEVGALGRQEERSALRTPAGTSVAVPREPHLVSA